MILCAASTSQESFFVIGDVSVPLEGKYLRQIHLEALKNL